MLGFFVSNAMRPQLAESQDQRKVTQLPSSKLLLNTSLGDPQAVNSFPVTATLSPDRRYLAILNNGRGTVESGYRQSIAVLDLQTNQLSDFPDSRLPVGAQQTYFLGLAFSSDGTKLYASFASLSDPAGRLAGDTGNGIAVYGFEGGRLSPQGFLKIPLQPLAPGKRLAGSPGQIPAGKANPYPAGLALVVGERGDELLVADNLSDDVLLLDAADGRVLQRFDLTSRDYVPASYPYAVVATRDGSTGYCSLWNASEVVELDLRKGGVRRRIALEKPESPTAAGSHPTAMLLSPDEKRLYVTLSNADAVAVIDTATGRVTGTLATKFPGEEYGGSYPNALAQSADGKRLFVADASYDAVAVFDLGAETNGGDHEALGFIPTEWYPTALAVEGNDLFILSGKGRGTGPNSGPEPAFSPEASSRKHPYIVSLIHGSVARVRWQDAEKNLKSLTAEVEQSNLLKSQASAIPFQLGHNPIKHVIYIIKENRTYDQIFGDLKPGNGDPSLVMYGEDITPNEHALARQFGVLDNFYCSGEVSGDGHLWSMAAITSDYNEKTWQIAYRGNQRTYDYEGEVAGGVPLAEGIPDVDEPGTGYIWGLVSRSGLAHRNYGEFVESLWCDHPQPASNPAQGTPLYSAACPSKFVHPGEALPWNVGEPHGSPSPWPWQIPLLARNLAAKPEIEASLDARFPDFRLDYPDQLRVDEFLNEFASFVRAKETGQGNPLPQFVILRLPNDHTAGTQPHFPTPSASVADNDLAVGRAVEAVSHSPYWDDTAIFILEDDAQDGADHVDAHRSTALVISKYSPGSAQQPFVDSAFYTTVNMIHTMEALLGLPPMNSNDAHAPVMAPLFSGPGQQPPFTADRRNQQNRLIYQMNPPTAPGAKESAQMDFSHADAVDTAKLNAILWRDRKGNAPMPAPRHAAWMGRD